MRSPVALRAKRKEESGKREVVPRAPILILILIVTSRRCIALRRTVVIE